MKYILLFISLLVANPCLANDSIGYLGAGGIEFKKTADISMESEVLTISRDLIRVEYEFLNTSSAPIKGTVIFPMPFYGFDKGCSPQHSGQLEGFRLWVDGVQQVTFRTVRAKLKDKDVTSRLRELGFTDEDIAEYRGVDGNCYSDNTVSTKGVFSENMEILRKEGLVDILKEENAVMATPLWKAAYFYSWDQVFPPKTMVHIVHEYVPFTGAISGLYSFADIGNFKKSSQDIVSDFCMSDGEIRAGKNIQARITTGTLKIPLEGLAWEKVNYILTTGANWAGPIKDFTLNLKKATKNELVSLCFDGNFNKSDDVTNTSHIRNFVPNRDITAIFFFNPLDSPARYKNIGSIPGYRQKYQTNR